jgi:hypothetical protein
MFVQQLGGNQGTCFVGQQSGHLPYHIVSAIELDLLMTTMPPRGPCVQFVGSGNDVTPPSTVPTFTNVSLTVCGSLE